jgi:hypothetical protein
VNNCSEKAKAELSHTEFTESTEIERTNSFSFSGERPENKNRQPLRGTVMLSLP